MKKIFIYLLLAASALAYNFNNRLAYSDEQIYFSILLADGQVVTLAGEEEYIVYRYGNTEELKMEYPDAEAISWEHFDMSYYEGEEGESYYLNFETAEYSYRIYEESYDGEVSLGLVVKDLSSGQTLDFESSEETLIGSLKRIYELPLMKKESL